MSGKRCRIVHVITTLERGGAQAHALYVAGHLDPARYETFLVSGPEGIFQAEARHLLGARWQVVPSLRRFPGLRCDLEAFCRLRRLLRRLKPDIVHTHSSKAGILGRWAAAAAGVPVIVHTIHGWSFHAYMPRLIRGMIIRLERATAKITTALLAVSRSDLEKGVRHGIGRAGRYHLVRHGPLPPFGRTTEAYDLPAQEQAPDVLAIACLKQQKNPLDIVRIASRVNGSRPRTHWAVAGDGPLRPRMEAFIRTQGMGDAVSLLGWRRDIAGLLHSARVVVLTSRWEGLPLAVLEAMAAGRPVVAYDVDGVGEAVEDGVTGYLVAPGDIVRFGEKVGALLDNPDLANTMGRAAQRVLQQRGYTVSAMMNALQRLYEQSVAGVRGKSSLRRV